MQVFKSLNETEYSHLMELLERSFAHDSEVCSILYLLATTGARVNEVLSLRKDQLDPVERTVHIFANKGSNNRLLPVDRSWFERIYNLHQGLYVFSSSYTRIRLAWLMYRPKALPLHSLRHTRAIRAYKASKDVHLVKELLGHKSINNTLIYMNYVNSRQNLKKVMR